MAENKKITIKLADSTEFEVESFNSNENYEVNTDTLFFVIPLKDQVASELVKKITPESMECISVLADGKTIDIIEGYTKLLSVDKTIDGFRQTITVRAATPKNTEEIIE